MAITQSSQLLILIAAMMLVTYLPRLLPFLLMQDLRLAPRFKRFLELIPFTALGALILPGVLSSVPGEPVAIAAGISFAVIWAWYKGGMMIPVAGAIGIVYFVLGMIT